MTRKVIGRMVAAVAVFAVLVFWIGPKLRHHPEAPQPGDVSLLLVERVSHFDGPFRLVRVTFRDGQMLPPETLWEDHEQFFKRTTPISRFFVRGEEADWEDDDWTTGDPISPHFRFYHVIDNQFVVTCEGGVFDLIEGRVIHRGSGRLIEVDGSTVVHGMRKNPWRNKYPVWENVTTFDLRTRRAERRDDPKYRLPGVRSPDGTKSVELGETQSTLHRVGQPPRPLGGFHVELDPHFSVIHRVPVLWLDNERFLTQTSNGVLVTVSLDGTRTPVVSIPVGREWMAFPQLHRDLAGRIIYDCDTPGVAVDVDARTWKRCEWIALGHEFEAAWGSSELRYKGRRVEGLKSWPHWSGRTATTEGYLALYAGVYHDEVRVWATTDKWFTIDVKPECFIGWVR